MFENFNIEKYKQVHYPSDNSLKTLNEIKKLKKTPLNTIVPKKYDEFGIPPISFSDLDNLL